MKKAKKGLVLLLAGILALSICACKDNGGKGGNGSNGDNSGGVSSVEKLSGLYELEQYTTPFWEGNTVYWESVAFVENADGTVDPAPLMYTPTKIISVRSPDMQVEYKEGRDYKLENGKLVWIESGFISCTTYDQLYPKYTGNTDWLMTAHDSERYVSLDQTVRKNQVYVTYEHADSWAAYKPESQKKDIPKTIAKLENKEPLKVVFYGDSITTGAEASGNKESYLTPDLKPQQANGNSAPYTPSWCEMVIQKMKDVYGYDDITKINKAAGTTASGWGATNAAELVASEKPDLVFIAFGMNEPNNSKEAFKQNYINIIQPIVAANPNVEFVFVSCMMPNPNAASFRNINLKAQEDAVFELLNDYYGVVAPVHSMNLAIMEQGKRFVDFTGNGLNHPNDFSIRVYAQTIMAAMGLY